MTLKFPQRLILSALRSAIGLIGALLVLAGFYLVFLGGTFYYCLAGIALCISSFFLGRNNDYSLLAFLIVSLGTTIWALVEVGFQIWLLIPRISVVPLIGLIFFVPLLRRSIHKPSLLTLNLFAMVLSVSILLYTALRFAPLRASELVQVVSPPDKNAFDVRKGDWVSWGGSNAGDRFSPNDQVNRDTVKKLTPAWTFDATEISGMDATALSQATMQVTPLHIGDSLYVCLGNNMVIALDEDSGKSKWKFNPGVNTEGSPAAICRGLAYYTDAAIRSGPCRERIVTATIDDRLIALDRTTGKLCRSFGVDGIVNLRANLGSVAPGTHYVTSPPTIVHDTIIVGGRVLDGRSMDMPSGTVRGYDARSGRLRWAWDALQATSNKSLRADEVLPRSSPNAWSVFSADETLGLVYIPTGGSAVDHYGGNRPPDRDRYASSIVALDVQSGDVKWRFQTVHHDIWDYDVASQPVVANLAYKGVIVPAIIAPTKRGEIFVLDRRNGTPIYPVVEQKVPQNSDAVGERLSPTQPYSVGFHSFNPPKLQEAGMWGATPFDLLYCRIKFRSLKYEGEFTPPSPAGSIIYPAVTGVFNWGSVSVDPARQILIANTNNLVTEARLIAQQAVNIGESANSSAAHTSPLLGAIYPQIGAPYAAVAPVFTSPLGFPCNAPPWGSIAAVSLRTGKLIWTQPLGTTRDVAPLGIALPTGIMGQGGSMVTASGLTFIGASFESVFRSFDTTNGEEVWSASLPAPARANPMSYVSSRTGRQYIVVAAGGASQKNSRARIYVNAFALPSL
jgi:quinoprotein glucose dehydrogenase